MTVVVWMRLRVCLMLDIEVCLSVFICVVYLLLLNAGTGTRQLVELHHHLLT